MVETLAYEQPRGFTVGQAAHLTGLPASTLRYYEDVGVVPPVGRDPDSGYRVYSQTDIDLLDAVACLAGTGMPVADMRAYLANLPRGLDGADDQVELLEAQRGRLDAEIRRLELRLEYLGLKVAFWRAVQAGDEAQVEAIRAKVRELAPGVKADRNNPAEKKGTI